MICPQCGHDNLPGSAFCDTCGYDLNQAPVYTPPPTPAAPVYPPTPAPAAPAFTPPGPAIPTAPAMGGAVICASCGTPSTTPGALFCDTCGAKLSAGAPPAPTWQPAPQPTYQPPAAPPYVAPAPAAPTVGATCPNCHQPVTPGAAFCDTCGTQLAGMGPAPIAPIMPQPVAPVPPMTPGVMHMRLVVAASGAQIPLAGKQEFLIGREDPIGNVFPDADLGPHGGDTGGVSRKHARILVSGSQVFIEDMDSTNGTWVDKQKVQPRQPVALQNGSEIRLGKVALIFQMS